MADFVSSGWSTYITVVSLVSILGCGVFLWQQSRQRVARTAMGETTGHSWDETLQEYNNPLPRWWMWLFYITIVFSLMYLYLYPGLGDSTGSLGWSQSKQYDIEVDAAKAAYEPLFSKYLAQDVKAVAADPAAREMGQRLYLTYCVQCHGSDARGSKGFPNLADRDWLHGGEPEKIKETILGGRVGVMPPMGEALGSSADVENVANYVLSLSDSAHDPLKAQLGKAKFATCAACHGVDGKGNPALGAPNLTDKVWLYGGSLATVMETITKGRTNQMPSFKELLGEGKAHVLAAYVYGLSNEPAAAGKSSQALPAGAPAATASAPPSAASAAADKVAAQR